MAGRHRAELTSRRLKRGAIPRLSIATLPGGVGTPPGGVLIEFINAKFRAHVEPSRRGTPKGDPIGFTRLKYCAIILSALLDVPLQDVARAARVRYGVLLKWRSERRFKAEIETVRREFVDYALKEYARHLQSDPPAFTRSLEELATAPAESEIFDPPGPHPWTATEFGSLHPTVLHQLRQSVGAKLLAAQTRGADGLLPSGAWLLGGQYLDISRLSPAVTARDEKRRRRAQQEDRAWRVEMVGVLIDSAAGDLISPDPERRRHAMLLLKLAAVAARRLARQLESEAAADQPKRRAWRA